MKNLAFILLFLGVFSSCTDQDQETITPGLVGKWVLKSYFMDPGDGSGKYQDAPKFPEQSITFAEDGTITVNSFVITDYKKYVVVDNGKIKFTDSNNKEVTVNYVLDGDELTVNPPCLEGCGFKFKKVN